MISKCCIIVDQSPDILVSEQKTLCLCSIYAFILGDACYLNHGVVLKYMTKIPKKREMSLCCWLNKLCNYAKIQFKISSKLISLFRKLVLLLSK